MTFLTAVTRYPDHRLLSSFPDTFDRVTRTLGLETLSVRHASSCGGFDIFYPVRISPLPLLLASDRRWGSSSGFLERAPRPILADCPFVLCSSYSFIFLECLSRCVRLHEFSCWIYIFFLGTSRDFFSGDTKWSALVRRL